MVFQQTLVSSSVQIVRNYNVSFNVKLLNANFRVHLAPALSALLLSAPC